MSKINYLFYSDYMKNKNLSQKSILIAKTKNSYLIGPLINSEFDGESFYKRIKSNSIYTIKIYKKILKKRCQFLINEYGKMLKSNEVIEVFKNGKILTHKIIKVPGDINETE